MKMKCNYASLFIANLHSHEQFVDDKRVNAKNDKISNLILIDGWTCEGSIAI
jgi:hypothetical protein